MSQFKTFLLPLEPDAAAEEELNSFLRGWIVGPVFAAVGLHRLEKGDFTGARKALWWGRGVNWAIVFAVVFWGFLALRSKAGR